MRKPYPRTNAHRWLQRARAIVGKRLGRAEKKFSTTGADRVGIRQPWNQNPWSMETVTATVLCYRFGGYSGNVGHAYMASLHTLRRHKVRDLVAQTKHTNRVSGLDYRVRRGINE